MNFSAVILKLGISQVTREEFVKAFLRWTEDDTHYTIIIFFTTKAIINIAIIINNVLNSPLFRQESFTTLLVNKVETQISFSWWDENILQMILRDADYQMNENVNLLKFWDALVFIEHQPFTNIHQTDDDESRWSADKHITRMKIFRWELFDNYLEQFLVFYWFVKTFCAELQFFLS